MTCTPSARIMEVLGGGQRPLYDTAPIGAASPSSSLLIETHRGERGAVHTRLIRDQVLTLFVEPGEVEHAVESGPAAAMAIPAGEVVLSLRNRPETVRWLKPALVTSVRVADHALDAAAAAMGLSRRPELVASGGLDDAKLTGVMQLLHLEQIDGFPNGPLFLDGLEQALAALLTRRDAPGQAPGPPPAGGLGARCARRLQDFVAANLDGSIRLADLANCAGYSPAHFTLLFRRTFGLTPHAYVQRARIARAKTLLQSGVASIVQVALDCGYQNQQHFSRVFRAETGVTPGAYRRERSE